MVLNVFIATDKTRFNVLFEYFETLSENFHNSGSGYRTSRAAITNYFLTFYIHNINIKKNFGAHFHSEHKRGSNEVCLGIFVLFIPGALPLPDLFPKTRAAFGAGIEN